jgi:hypothetical protein
VDTEQVISADLEPAFDSGNRRRLLGRTSTSEGSSLNIPPCSSIHMVFMRFPIDVIFVARDRRIQDVLGVATVAHCGSVERSPPSNYRRERWIR